MINENVEQSVVPLYINQVMLFSISYQLTLFFLSVPAIFNRWKEGFVCLERLKMG